MEPYITGDGEVIPVIEFAECPRCDYGVAPITPEGVCLNCYLIVANQFGK